MKVTANLDRDVGAQSDMMATTVGQLINLIMDERVANVEESSTISDIIIRCGGETSSRLANIVIPSSMESHSAE